VTQAIKAPAALLDELGVTEPTEIIVEAIAQHCGATIVYEPLDGCSARILASGDRAIITVDANAPLGRQRFSAGHELGHWMQDRGRVAFSCTEKNLVRDWDGENPERRANRFAANLLLPGKMFERASAGMPPTLESARSLANTFNMSLTATAIRLVELGPLPAMIVCSEKTGRRWFFRSRDVPKELWPLERPGAGTVAMRLLTGGTGRRSAPETVDADEWIDHMDASRYAIVEDSVIAMDGTVLSLLWWKDEAQILAFTEDEEDAEPPLTGHLTFGRRTKRR
jgi:Zn-dependent peptidase ImmA (M78 family)